MPPSSKSPEMAGESFAFPPSFAQQRLWFLDQLAPGNAFYNIPASFRFAFALNVGVLELSLTEMVRRHESLRTRFVAVNGAPVQKVEAPAPVNLPVMDLRTMPPAERDAEALRLTQEEARRPFDLAQGPLVRASLLRMGDADYIFLLTLHHIISDGWSMVVFSRELTALYTAFGLERPSPLPAIPIQYADFAVWQRSFLTGDRLASELSWWRQRLADLPVLRLPTDRPRPPIATYEGAARSLVIPPVLCARLRELGRREEATLFMTLLAGFVALLHRYSGQDDVVVGAPTAGRNRSELEPLIGFFVNTLVLRLDLRGDPSFRELLRRVRETTSDAYAHQDVPFEKLVEELQPRRDPSRNPLFQVTFQLFSNLGVPLAPAANSESVPGVERGAAVFDLAVNLWEAADRLLGQIEFSTALFDAETITRLSGHFLRLLEGAVANPDLAVSRMAMLSAAERHRAVVEWNRTATPYPRDLCIPARFMEIARRFPERVAVQFEDERLTYSELDARADRLARRLRKRGVGPESLVGVCLERGAEMVVALLAILKAGAAYVPLDPGYPAERLRFMTADSSPVLVVASSRGSPLFAESRIPWLALDGEDAEFEDEQGTPLPPPPDAAPDSIAYVMYTSGSTGRPKGAAIPHRGVLRLVCDGGVVDAPEEETFLQFAPISFDASTFEIWGALLNGGRLVVHPPDTPSLEDLGRFIVEHRVTTLWLTSSLFQQMVDGPIESLAGVRQLLAGGDVLSPEHVRRFLRRFPGHVLINGYGPTENTTFTCCHRLTREEDVGATVPIGRPIGNTRVHVVDRHLQPVPVGVPGELLTGGDGLALGYLGQPDLTRERFIRDPFSPDPAARLYRTGDLARHRPDGAIEFLGRLDHQAKIRGYRIEPGEVEAVLRRREGVRDAAVVLHRRPDGDKVLVAYVVGDASAGRAVDGGTADPTVDAWLAGLREFARGHLPEFMVPSRLLRLEAMPLNPNGKLDRGALPDPDHAIARTSALVAPRSEPEERLALIFREVLGLERVGIHDHFFADLGGHSLRATQLVSRIRESFDIDLPLRAVFDAPTVAGLAVLIEELVLREIESLSDAEAEAQLVV